MSWLTRKTLDLRHKPTQQELKNLNNPLKVKATINNFTNTQNNIESSYLDYLGLQRVGNPEGKYYYVANGLKSVSDDRTFDSSFTQKSLSNNRLYSDEDRFKLYEQIKVVESQLPDIKYTVQKYLSESYSTNTLLPVAWKSDNKKNIEVLTDIFTKSPLDFDEIIRNLIRFGDSGVFIFRDKTNNFEFFRVLEPLYYEVIVNNPFNIPVAYRFTDRFFEDYELSHRYEKVNLYEKFKDNLLMPWEFVQFSINKGSNLYGKGLIEDLLFYANRLLTSEDLTAFYKASKFDKVVLKIPTVSDIPTVAFREINSYKELIKESLFGTTRLTGTTNTQEKISGITDNIIIPSNKAFDISKVSSADTANPDMKDSDYYRDALRLGTGIPLNEFASNSNDGRNSQSLKFRDSLFRKFLKPIVQSVSLGMTYVSNLLLIGKGLNPRNPDNLVECYLKGNDFVDQEYLDVNKNKLQYIADLSEILKKIKNPEEGNGGGGDKEGGFENGDETVTQPIMSEPFGNPDENKFKFEVSKFLDLCDYLKIDNILLDKLLKIVDLGLSKEDLNSIRSKLEEKSKEVDLNKSNKDIHKQITGSFVIDSIINNKITDIDLSDLGYDTNQVNAFFEFLQGLK